MVAPWSAVYADQLFQVVNLITNVPFLIQVFNIVPFPHRFYGQMEEPVG